MGPLRRNPEGRGFPGDLLCRAARPWCLPWASRRFRAPKASVASMRGLLRGSLVRSLSALAQEAKELDALTQAALHHFRALHHLADDRRDLAAAEIEAPVERLHGIEDLGMAQMRVVQRSDLHAVRVDQLG